MKSLTTVGNTYDNEVTLKFCIILKLHFFFRYYQKKKATLEEFLDPLINFQVEYNSC